MLRFTARSGAQTSGAGIRPECGLPPDATIMHTNQEPKAGCIEHV
jgi:hypothetical protein